MGFEIARKFAEYGANVVLISGPTHLQLEHPLVKRIDVVSAQQMFESCLEEFKQSDITVMAAAVADFTPQQTAGNKIKKTETLTEIKLKPAQDILKALGQLKHDSQILVGFALETDNELENARKKIENKNLDFIVLNSLRDKDAGFGHETNKITIINREGMVSHFALKPKSDVAEDIVKTIESIVLDKKGKTKSGK